MYLIFLFPFLFFKFLFIVHVHTVVIIMIMLTRPIKNIGFVMSADVWGTDHTRWLPGETGHTEVCTLTIGDCCYVW